MELFVSLLFLVMVIVGLAIGIGYMFDLFNDYPEEWPTETPEEWVDEDDCPEWTEEMVRKAKEDDIGETETKHE